MWTFLRFLVSFVVLVLVLAGAAVFYGLYHFGQGLPDYKQLAVYEPPTVTRVHAGDGRLLAEYATEKRVFVPVDAMPKRVIQAFLAAEDKSFFTHPGIDFLGVLRAAYMNLRNVSEGRRLVGASTITQQVAKNFLLSNELSYSRKIREAILAFRIERAFTKNQILELYLNEIYLGAGSYGVAAAALNYFNKSLDELDLAETAYLAALPKAPSNYHPVRNATAAKARRDWVLGRMAEEGFVDAPAAAGAMAVPLVVRERAQTEVVEADYFAEEVRRQLLDLFGEARLYQGGLSVRTTLDPRLQRIAQQSLRAGLIDYDRRHGWRGPIARVPLGEDWRAQLAGVTPPLGLYQWQLAVVLETDATGARIGLGDGSQGRIALEALKWARAAQGEGRLGASVQAPDQVLTPGDVVAVERLTGDDVPADAFALRQIPKLQGGIVAINPHTGRVLALSGGYSFAQSQFNRVSQALRQPGSAFKPFVYLTALEHGFTPSSLILDAPIVIDQGPNLPKWKPSNYSERFYGPSTLRLGVEKSRNAMTVRLAERLGVEPIVTTARRFGIGEGYPPQLSVALGAGETTLLRLSTAYAMLVNGGFEIEPALIERIQDRHGRTIYRRDVRECRGCRDRDWSGQEVPPIPDERKSVVDPAIAYQMVSILEGVVQRGTGVRARAVGKPLGGKTGTTNDSFDAWFIGFSPDLVVGVYTGFDEPAGLGARETGSSVAAPIFTAFMAAALADDPAIPFRIPPGVRLVRVDADTGLPARPGDRNVILEAFRPGTEPQAGAGVIGVGADGAPAAVQLPAAGTGGLY